MESLSFSQLALQLAKNHQFLVNSCNLIIDIEQSSDGNIYRDLLVLKRQIGFKWYFFTTRPYLWDRYRQFAFHASTDSGQYHYRVNPQTNLPVRIYSNQLTDAWSNQSAMPPADLAQFADECWQIVQRVFEQIVKDKFSFDISQMEV